MGRINNDATFFMSYVRGEDRGQAALLPAAIEDYVAADAPVRVIDAFVDGLDAQCDCRLAAQWEGEGANWRSR